MIFYIGQKVILKHTGDTGIIQQIMTDGMIAVMIDFENMVIPVYEEDLLTSEDEQVQKRAISKPAKMEEQYHIDVDTQYGILNSLGLQIGFEAIMAQDTIDKYRMYLINDTKSELLFIFKLQLNEQQLLEVDNIIKDLSVFFLGEISYDTIIAIPDINIEIREISTLGVGEPLSRSIKLKPKNFFKSVVMAPLLNKQVHHFVFFDHFNNTATKKREIKEDLKSYTNRVMTPQKKHSANFIQNQQRKLSKHEINEFAHFSAEIDLHIENLTDKYEKMSNSEIINLQLRHFDEYMDKAFRLGVERIFIIHGLGKGTLRDAIATRLIQDRRIQSFVNEYHPKYGFGATEVIF